MMPMRGRRPLEDNVEKRKVDFSLKTIQTYFTKNVEAEGKRIARELLLCHAMMGQPITVYSHFKEISIRYNGRLKLLVYRYF